MSSRLRKMMSKRSQKNMPVDPGELQSRLAAVKDNNDKSEPVAQDDLSNIPPPPADKVEAVRESSRKVSPSKALLDRYKTRSVEALRPSRPTIKIPDKSPRSDADSPSPRGTSFKNDFEMYEASPTSSKRRQSGNDRDRVTAASPEADKQTRTLSPAEAGPRVRFTDEVSGFSSNEYRGVRRGKQPVVKGPDREQEENKAPERHGMPPATSERRRTRSSTRRKERTDSHDDDKKDSADVPPALTIRKSTSSPARSSASPTSPSKKRYNVFDLVESIPGPGSPRRAERKEEPGRSSPSPARTSSERERSAQVNVSVTELPKEEPEEAAEETQASTAEASTPPPVYDDFKYDKSEPLPKRLSKLRITRSSSKKDAASEEPGPKDSPVAVRPPVYNESKGPSHQWESELGSTSRPIGPWMYSKRWTCCHCQGQTIVEQTVCSCVLCAHDRCPTTCRLERQERFKGPFSGPF